MADPLSIITDTEAAASALHPLRRQLLDALVEQSDSAAGLARRLNLPRQKLNYHLRELESHGLIELEEERPRGNCRERVMRASSAMYIVDPDVLGRLGDSAAEARDQFSSTHLIASAARVVRDVATLRQRATDAGQTLATLSLEVDVRFASAAHRNEFAEELTQLIGRLAATYHDEQAPQGRVYRFMMGAHPVITKDVPS